MKIAFPDALNKRAKEDEPCCSKDLMSERQSSVGSTTNSPACTGGASPSTNHPQQPTQLITVGCFGSKVENIPKVKQSDDFRLNLPFWSPKIPKSISLAFHLLKCVAPFIRGKCREKG